MAKIVGMNVVHLPDAESDTTAIRDLTSQYVSDNPGAFRCSDSNEILFNVAEFDVMLKYIYDLQAMGYTQYIEGFGCQEWLDEIGPYYPDPRKPVIEEITMFAYAYEEGMVEPQWRVFNQIDTVYVYLRQNGWDTSSMSAEDGRRYDDGELGERVMTVRGPLGYADAFRAEYNRRYPDYDTILVQKDYLPERGRPAPEPTNEREYNCYHDPYDWSDMYRTIEQIQMEGAQYMADVYVNPSDDWEPISDPDTGEVIGHGRIIIRTTDEYQDIITANGQQWYYPASIEPAGK